MPRIISRCNSEVLRDWQKEIRIYGMIYIILWNEKKHLWVLNPMLFYGHSLSNLLDARMQDE